MAKTDQQYRDEYKTSGCMMSEAQFVSLRRAEDGLEDFVPPAAPPAATDVGSNPLASELVNSGE